MEMARGLQVYTSLEGSKVGSRYAQVGFLRPMDVTLAPLIN